jgi:hypothetical protein
MLFTAQFSTAVVVVTEGVVEKKKKNSLSPDRVRTVTK